MELARILTVAALLIGVNGVSIAQAVDLPAGRVVGDGEMQVGRYTTTVAASAKVAAQPLDVYVQLNYPRQTVHTVGDAIRHTLLRTGWRLVDTQALEPQAARLLTLPLPESQRAVGPYRARTVLEVLTGSSWTWHEDPVQRLVWFTVKSTGQPVQLSDSQVPVRAAEVQAITTGVAASIVEAHDLPQQNTHESPAGSQ